MRTLVLCGAVLCALLSAAPAVAKHHTRLHHCKTVGLGALVASISKHGPSCQDVRVLIRSVEAHASQCRPYTQETIAPYRQCRVTPVLSTGERRFRCRSAYEVQGSNKRWWRVRCRSHFGDVVHYRRDGSHI